jgi:hypothetical protein
MVFMTNEPGGRSGEPGKPHNTLFPKDMEAAESERTPLRGRWAAAARTETKTPETDAAGAQTLDATGDPSAAPKDETPPHHSGAPAPESPVLESQASLHPLPLVAELRQAIDTLERLATALETIDVLLHHEGPQPGQTPAIGRPSPPPSPALSDLLSRRAGRGDLQDILRQYLLR